MKRLHFVRTLLLAIAAATSASAVVVAQQAATAVQAKPVDRRPAQGARLDGPEGFSIVLVMGEMQPSSAQNNVPPAAQKALADMKDFLPYKGYRLLDAQWTLCCGRSPVMTLLQGPDDHEYSLELSAAPVAGNNVNVRFELSDMTARERTRPAGASDTITQLQRELETLRARRAELAGKGLPPTHPDVRTLDDTIASRARELESAVRRARTTTALKTTARRRIIDASFRMDVGETVVVGTSRIQGGDRAVIALLTAVPQRGSAARER